MEQKWALGPTGTVVSIFADDAPFSFLLRDVSPEYPIFIPRYGVAVTPADDSRGYGEIELDISKLGGRTKLRQIEADEEESYDSASSHTVGLHCPTWFGLGRDIRLFEFDDSLINFSGHFGPCIKPRYPIGYMAEKHKRAQPQGASEVYYNFKSWPRYRLRG